MRQLRVQSFTTLPAAHELKESLVAPNGVVCADYKRAGEVELGTVEVQGLRAVTDLPASASVGS